MTDSSVPVDDPTAVHRILANASALLLDFDGPVCSVFAGLPAPVVADQLREVLADGGHGDLPPEVEKSADPFDVFSFAATIGDVEARYVEAALRAHEVEAVATAEPTADTHDLIREWHASGRKLAIVSNNSAAAVLSYFHAHDLTHCVDNVSARREADPGLLKPNPFLLNQANDALGTAASNSVLIGDSLTDIQAARSAGVRIIGYANKPSKLEEFAAAEPDTIITEMKLIAQRC
ncbi:HAD family hydrolase [Lentzea roselyniae]|uniref:HAD family hydrolase n=1 Tax=Lentzea roselyniae TaxID=531940 RepID=A0ABP6ZVM3_9PSEU